MATTRRGFFGVLAGALVATKAAPSIVQAIDCGARPASSALTFRGVPVLVTRDCDPRTIYLVHPTVARTYQDLMRSDEAMWRIQR